MTGGPLRDRLLTLAQQALPQHALSRLGHRLTRLRWTPIKNLLIRAFLARHPVDLGEAAVTEPYAYESFNAFFTRALRAGARPLAAADGPVSPVDGRISQLGTLTGDRLVQAKGRIFTAADLLASRRGAADFRDGAFATLYLAPPDYHRVHMPVRGTLVAMRHIPGRLFSVNPATTRSVPNLFARNERVVCHFDTAAGPLALVLVGALLVGSIETVWAGEVTPPRARRVRDWHYGSDGPAFAPGDEIGRFNMGSTVILLLPAGTVAWAPELGPGAPVRVGQRLGDSTAVRQRPRARAAPSGTR